MQLVFDRRLAIDANSAILSGPGERGTKEINVDVVGQAPKRPASVFLRQLRYPL